MDGLRAVLFSNLYEIHKIKGTITLIGLSDPNFTLKGDMFGEAPAMVSTKLNSLVDDESSYTILLSHCLELFESYAHCNIILKRWRISFANIIAENIF